MLPHRDSKLVRSALFVLFGFLVVYALYEGWGMLYGPEIQVPDQITSHEAYILVRGQADRIAELRLNGTAIAVTESGEFEAPYLLARGSNHLILEARDARGRSTMKEVDILYVPQENQPPASPAATAPEEG